VRFSDIRHQDRAIAILKRGLGSGRIHHAYLFDGPEGVGKEMTGRALATRLLCEDDRLAPDADACGRCPACRLMATDNHPDFHLVHRGLHNLHPDPAVRASKGLFLVVDVVRHFVIEPVAMKPSRGRRRVFLIRDAERMNEEAQNALLKTLEEPPGSASLILVTSSAARLLPTIRSRCQCVPFGWLPVDFVAQELSTRLNLPPAQSQSLARLSDGRLGVAIRWHQIGLLEAIDTVAGCLGRVPEGDPESFARSLLDLAAGLAAETGSSESDADTDAAEEGPLGNQLKESADMPARGRPPASSVQLREALKLVLLLIAAFYRDALAVQLKTNLPLSLPPRNSVALLAEQSPPDRLEAGLLAVREAELMLDRNVPPQLACERLAVALLGELPPA